MINTLYWVAGVITVGFIFGKLIHNFVAYIVQSIKDSEERDR